MLLTMEEARQRLDLDADAMNDATLRALIAAAEFAVTDFLGHGYARDAQPPEAIRAAAAVAIGEMLEAETPPRPLSENRTFAGLLSVYRQPDRAGAA